MRLPRFGRALHKQCQEEQSQFTHTKFRADLGGTVPVERATDPVTGDSSWEAPWGQNPLWRREGPAGSQHPSIDRGQTLLPHEPKGSHVGGYRILSSLWILNIWRWVCVTDLSWFRKIKFLIILETSWSNPYVLVPFNFSCIVQVMGSWTGH